MLALQLFIFLFRSSYFWIYPWLILMILRILWTPEGSLTHSQVPASCTNPEPDRFSTYTHIPLQKIHLNIILPSTSGSSKRSLSLTFPHQNPVYNSPHRIRVTCPVNLILLDTISRTIFVAQCRSLSASLCSFLHSPVTSSLLGTNISQHLFSDTLSLRSSINMSDQVSHPYKTRGKIIVLCILMFKFLDSKSVDKRFYTN